MSGISLGSYSEKPEILIGKSAPAKKTESTNDKVLVNKKNSSAKKDTLLVNTTYSKQEVVGSINFFSKADLPISDLKYIRHFDGPKPIAETVVNRVNKKFDDIMYDALYTPYKLAVEIFSDPRLTNNEKLKEAVNSFTKTLASKDKETLIYVKEAITRNPKINDNDLTEIFNKLSEMSTTKYDERIPDTKEFVMLSLHDIAAPSDISQEGIGTCTGTAIQIQMAIRIPKEYINMIDKLAKNQSYTTITGSVIPPNWTFVNEGKEGNEKSFRTITAKVMQNAIMDFGDEKERDFDSSKGDRGLSYEQTSGTLNKILNKNFKTYEIWENSTDQLIAYVQKSNPSAENPIEISLSYEVGGRDAFHSVDLIALNPEQNKVTIVNPWGREESFPFSELEKRIMSVSALKDLDIGLTKLSPLNPNTYNLILDKNSSAEALKGMLNTDKMDLVSIVSGFNYNSSENTKKLSAEDKKVIITILENVFKSGDAVNDRMYELLISRVGKDNIPKLISIINNNSLEYQTLKVKLEYLKK